MSTTGPRVTRRTFLRNSALTASALNYSRAASRAAGAGPSDTLRVAMAGWGQQATFALAPSLVKIPGVTISAICDISEFKTGVAKRSIDPQGKTGLQTFLHYDEMLEKAGKDFDAVIIATPCWMHSSQTRKALEAGKHVYCEKMMSHTLEPARDMVRAQRQTGKLLQIGHQRRSNPHYLRLRDKIINGPKLLGRITHAQGQWNRSIRMPLLPKISAGDMAGIQAAGYSGVFEYANWRWFKKYGGGPLTDLGSHQIDIFSMMLGVPPRSVIASGGTDFYKDLEYQPGKKLTYENLDNTMIIYEYDAPGHGLVRAHYQFITTSGFQGYHEKFHGTGGAALISEMLQSRFYFSEIYREPADNNMSVWQQAHLDGVVAEGDPYITSSKETISRLTFHPLSKELDEKFPHQHHLENFFDTIRRGGKQSDLACPVEEAFKTSVAVLAVNDAVREQRRIELKPESYVVD